MLGEPPKKGGELIPRNPAYGQHHFDRKSWCASKFRKPDCPGHARNEQAFRKAERRRRRLRRRGTGEMRILGKSDPDAPGCSRLHRVACSRLREHACSLERFSDRCSGCHGHLARAALAKRQWHPYEGRYSFVRSDLVACRAIVVDLMIVDGDRDGHGGSH